MIWTSIETISPIVGSARSQEIGRRPHRASRFLMQQALANMAMQTETI
jgi:hypothetical protein